MHTRCPHCDTCFRVTEEQLQLAQGAVRCGRCFGTFNAREHLIDAEEARPPEKTEERSEPPKASPGEPPSRPAPEQETEAKPEEKETPREEKKGDEPPPEAPALDVVEEIESRSLEQRRRSKRRTLAGLTLIALLLATLAGQYLHANRQTLAQNPDTRPLVEALCAVAGCEVPLLRKPQYIKLVDRDIRSHPRHDNALLVEAVMVNEAPFTQAYPNVRLTLLDITGKTLSGRSFTPREYLPPTVDADAGMAPGKQIGFVLVLVDPGEEAVGFEFEFL